MDAIYKTKLTGPDMRLKHVVCFRRMTKLIGPDVRLKHVVCLLIVLNVLLLLICLVLLSWLFVLDMHLKHKAREREARRPTPAFLQTPEWHIIISIVIVVIVSSIIYISIYLGVDVFCCCYTHVMPF